MLDGTTVLSTFTMTGSCTDLSSAKNASDTTTKLRVFGDTDAEDHETITVTLQADPDNALPSDLSISSTNNSATYTVTADDVSHTLSLSMATTSAAEGAPVADGTDPFQLTKYEVSFPLAPSTPAYAGGVFGVKLCVSGTADIGTDYHITDFAVSALDIDNDNCLTGGATLGGTHSFSEIYIQPIGDDTPETNETVILTISRFPSGNQRTPAYIAIDSMSDTVTFTIQNDDGALLPEVTVAAGTSPVTEGGNAEFTLTASPAPSANLPVDITITDAPNADFVASSNQGSKTVTIPTSGSVTYTVPTVGGNNETVDEPKGPVTLTVVDGTGYTPGTAASAAVTVEDNDPTPVTLAGAAGDVVEGNGKTFTLTLGRPLYAGESLVAPVVFGGAATYGASPGDYTVACPSPLPAGVVCANFNTILTPKTVTFTGPSASSVTLTLNAPDDGQSAVEPQGELVTIGLGTLTLNLGGGGATTTDNLADFKILDEGHVVSLSMATTSAEEGGSGATASYPVSFSVAPARSAGSFKVDLCLTGTAEWRRGTDEHNQPYATDYHVVDAHGATWAFVGSTGCLSGGLTLPASSAGYALRPVGESVIESDETVILTLSRRTGTTDPTPGDVVIDSTAGAVTFTIEDDDTSPPDRINVTPTALTLDELDADGDLGTDTYTVALNTDPGSGVTVIVASTLVISGGATISPGALTFTGGSGGTWATAQTVTVTAVNDGDITDGSNQIALGASAPADNPYNGASAGPVTVNVTDAGHAVLAGKSALTVDEGDATETYTLRLASDPGAGTVTLTPASDDTDVAAVSAAVSFTTTTWKTPQTVTVTGKETGSAGITHTITTGTTAYPTSFTPLPTLSVTVDDVITAIGGPHEVAADWALKPSAITAGGSFRLLFVTSEWHNAESAAVSRYNTHVQYWADTTRGHAAINAYKDDVRAVASTATVDAIDNVDAPTATAGIPIYWLDGSGGGAKVADDYADFWDGSWDNYAGTDRRDETGAAASGMTPADWPWTGTADDGTATAHPLGSATPSRGALPTDSPLDHGAAGRDGAAGRHTLYALSPVFTVASAPSLSAGSLTHSGATLTLSNVSGTWYHKRTAPTAGTCSTTGLTGSSLALTGLTPSTAYTWAVYSDSACATELASVSFTTAATPPGLTLSKSSLTIDELDADGNVGTGTYTVRLDTDPGDGVTVTVGATSDDTGAAQPSPAAGLEFTGGSAGTWATPQTFTVAAPNDGDVMNESVTISHRATVGPGSTNPYHQLDGPDLTVTVTDAGHGVIASESTLNVREGDGTATYTLRLKSEPGGTVTIAPASGDTTHATVSAAVSFDNTDWATEKTVTVTGKGSAADTATITHTITAGTTAYPTGTPAADLPEVAVTVTASTLPAVTIAADAAAVVMGQPAWFTLSSTPAAAPGTAVNYRVDDAPGRDFIAADDEGSDSVQFRDNTGAVRIFVQTRTDGTAASAGDVTVTLSCDPAQCTVGTPAAATVTVRLSADPGVRVTETGAGTAVTEDSGSDSYAVALDSAPTHNVTVTVTAPAGLAVDGPDAGGTGTATETLTFTPTTWATAQTVTVTAPDDSTDRPRAQQITHAATSTDTDYNNISIDPVPVTLTDDDPTTVTLSVPDASATEGDSADSATLALTLGRALTAGESLAVPLAFAGGARGTDFTLALAGTPRGVSLSGTTVTFTGSAAGSATTATVALSALADADTTDDTVTVSIPASSTGTPPPPVLTATGLDGGATGSRTGNGQVTLAEPSDLPVLTITGGAAVTEGGNAVFTVTADKGPASAVFLGYDIDDAPGESDFLTTATESGNTLWRLAAGATTATLSLPTVNDTTDEPDGAITVTLLARPTQYRLGTPHTATVTVRDNDGGTGTTDNTDNNNDNNNNGNNNNGNNNGGGSGGSGGGGGNGGNGADDAEDPPAVTLTIAPPAGTGAGAGTGAPAGALRLAPAGTPAGTGMTVHTGRYTLALTRRPAGTVTLTPVSSDPAVAAVAGALTFPRNAWATPQTVTVTGLTPGRVGIAHRIAGGGYEDATIPEVTVIVGDGGIDPRKHDTPPADPAADAEANATAGETEHDPASGTQDTPADGNEDTDAGETADATTGATGDAPAGETQDAAGDASEDADAGETADATTGATGDAPAGETQDAAADATTTDPAGDAEPVTGATPGTATTDRAADGAATGAMADPATGTVTDAATGTVAAATGPAAGPATDPATDPGAGATAAPGTDLKSVPTNTVTDASADPADAAATDPETADTAGPASETVTDPVTDTTAAPGTDLKSVPADAVTDATPGAADGAATGPVSETVTDPAADAEPGTELKSVPTDADAVTEPVTEATTEPAPDPTPAPAGALAALARGHLDGARAILGARLTAGSNGPDHLTLAGRSLSLKTLLGADGSGLFGAAFKDGFGRGFDPDALPGPQARPLSWLDATGRCASWTTAACGEESLPGGEGTAHGGQAGLWDTLLYNLLTGQLSGLNLNAALWRDSGFALTLGGPDEDGIGAGRAWTLWGRGHVNNVTGLPAGSGIGNELRTGYLGIDTAFGETGRWGLALSRGQGESALHTVHPYLSWSDGTTRLSALGGLGRSSGHDRRAWTQADIPHDVNAAHTAPDAAHAGPDTRPLSDPLGLSMGRVDLARPLGNWAGLTLDLRGDAAWARLAREDDNGHTLQAETVRTLRMGIAAGGHLRNLTALPGLSGLPGLTLRPALSMHLRHDAGDGPAGRGLELAGGLDAGRGPWRLTLKGRLLATHSDSTYRERGLHATLARGQPGTVGSSLSLNARWGDNAGGGDTLWAERVHYRTGFTDNNAWALDGRAGYGWRLPGGALLHGALSVSHSGETPQALFTLELAPGAAPPAARAPAGADSPPPPAGTAPGAGE